MQYYQFVFDNLTNENKEMLIALLSNVGFEGFEEEDDILKACTRFDEFDETEFKNIIDILNIKYSKSIIKETNWNEKWELGFKPVIVHHPILHEPFAIIRAGFHKPVKEILHELVITPKMSFGTGHHATTYLMIQQMSLLDFNEKGVIDFGTGTGVLAILAEKMGASEIVAIDHDNWSIDNAQENIEANHCSKIRLLKAETIGADVDLKADIILANINLNIIIKNLDALKAACGTGAAILFSGILKQDEAQIVSVLKQNGLVISACFTRDNWLIIVAIR
ncbi:MAG: 50S ribosomal protein L11 methyltransferase [Ferruginibacter sp.]